MATAIMIHVDTSSPKTSLINREKSTTETNFRSISKPDETTTFGSPIYNLLPLCNTSNYTKTRSANEKPEQPVYGLRE